MKVGIYDMTKPNATIVLLSIWTVKDCALIFRHACTCGLNIRCLNIRQNISEFVNFCSVLNFQILFP